MAQWRPGSPEQDAFREELLEAGLFVASGVPGIYGRSAAFEDIRLRFDALVSRVAEVDAPEALAFTPLIPRRQLELTGYLKSFPHLAGTVFGFEGTEADAAEQEQRAARHEDWSAFQEMSDLVLTPAACYPVYPAVAARGPLAAGGVVIDPGPAFVFRREPAGDPARLQSFHMRELVRIGEPQAVAAWRDAWRDRALTLLRGLGLEADFDIASDPFFGRSGRMLAASQREQELKFEILAPIAGDEPTAIASFNYHQDHFSSKYDLRMADGEFAHTACLGFGEERVTLALLRCHGLDATRWPDAVRTQLWG